MSKKTIIISLISVTLSCVLVVGAVFTFVKPKNQRKTYELNFSYEESYNSLEKLIEEADLVALVKPISKSPYTLDMETDPSATNYNAQVVKSIYNTAEQNITVRIPGYVDEQYNITCPDTPLVDLNKEYLMFLKEYNGVYFPLHTTGTYLNESGTISSWNKSSTVGLLADENTNGLLNFESDKLDELSIKITQVAEYKSNDVLEKYNDIVKVNEILDKAEDISKASEMLSNEYGEQLVECAKQLENIDLESVDNWLKENS